MMLTMISHFDICIRCAASLLVSLGLRSQVLVCTRGIIN